MKDPMQPLLLKTYSQFALRRFPEKCGALLVNALLPLLGPEVNALGTWQGWNPLTQMNLAVDAAKSQPEGKKPLMPLLMYSI